MDTEYDNSPENGENETREYDVLEEVFKSLPLFGHLPEEAIKSFSDIAFRVHAYRGQTIIEEGEEGGDLYILLEGRVGISLESINPSMEIAINKVGPGEPIGEMSLLEGGPRSATVVSLERCVLARLSGAKMNKIFQQHPEWGMIFMRNLAVILTARLRTMNRRILNMTRARYM